MAKTPKSKDKRTRLDLDLFIMAMIERGVNTPYTLMTIGSLSQGATVPALARLESDGYVKRGDEKARGRNDYALTRTGRVRLDRSWRSLIELDPVGEIETILRIASLACLMGLPSNKVKMYLRRAAENRKSSASQRSSSSGSVKSGDTALYSKAKQIADSKRLLSEVAALRSVAASLRK
jgi:DNA-binding PadR family transcriptional regulator